MLLVLLLHFTIYIVSQNVKNVERVPWGIWDCEPINACSPIMEIYSGKYYYSFGKVSWVGISQNAKGIIAGNFNFHLLAMDGIFVRIEKFENITDGLILYIVGDGIRHDTNGPKFKDNVQIKIKMTFLSENECMFQYYSKTDQDGFKLTFSIKENVIYRRYKVE